MLQAMPYPWRELGSTDFEAAQTHEAGFTLIELMVVLLIIAILLAIAVPTFLGVTGSANDRSAQSNLTNALTEASASYQSNNQTYAGISAALVTAAPEFAWSASNASVAAGTNQVSVNPVDVASTSDAKGVILAALSKSSSTCWWVVQLNTTPNATGIASTGFNTAASGAGFQSGASNPGTFYAKKVNGGTNCKANFPENAGAAFNWGTSYANAGVN
jgi:type IV pilus assembly protein PilA